MMSGKSMMINMTTISTNRNGIFCFTIFSSDCFDMPQATNKFMPSGRVRKPMHRLIVISTPKYTTSYPTLATMG
jgi:hypothetical protein